MSSLFQGLPMLSDGRVRAYQVTAAGLPTGSILFRGFALHSSGRLLLRLDTGGTTPKVFNSGIALEASTGIVLASEGTAVPFTRPPGGLMADANGALVVDSANVNVIHQGVGLNDGALAAVIETIPP